MVEAKLIMIEGIPGVGKSTTAAKLKAYLDAQGIPSRLYLESDCENPSDLAWVSVLSEDDYSALLSDYPQYQHTLQEYSERQDNHVMVYYQKMRNSAGREYPDELMDFLSRHEPYDGKVPAEEFIRLLQSRYSHFAQRAAEEKELYIFESSFLQNLVNELMGFHNLDKSKIKAHLSVLMECLKGLNPILVYLVQPDVRETLRKAAEERRSPDKSLYPDWIDHVIRYITNSKFGRENHLQGFEGTVEFFERRKEIELEALERLEAHTIIIDNSHLDAEKAVQRALDF